MKNINRYIYLLLLCILLQNDHAGVLDLFRKLMGSDRQFSLFEKDIGSSSAEEEKEENEKESKENESKENENKEKEKEFKNIKYLHSFVFLSTIGNINTFQNPEDAKLFSSESDIDTPPPKSLLVIA